MLADIQLPEFLKDPTMNTANDSHNPYAGRPPRHVPPLLLLGVAVMLGFAALVGVLTVLAKIEPPAPLFNLPTLAEATMPDGSLLTVHAVREGTPTHELHVDLPAGGGFFGVGSRREVVHYHAHSTRISVWMTRRNAKTGKSLDFDWWKRSAIVDQHGNELRDWDPQRQIYSGYSHSSVSGGRPFAPDTTADHSGTPRLILVASGFKAFRSGKTFKLRVYNTADEMVGEFDLPSPTTSSPPTWTPESLPSTKSDGDLAVTLKKVRIHEHKYNNGEGEQVNWNVMPEVSYEQGGKATTMWYANTQLLDALGNHNNWQGNLSAQEPAWKLILTCYRSDTAEFGPNEVTESDWIELPGKDQTTSMNMTVKNSVQSLDIVRAIGPGETTVTEDVGTNIGGYSSNGQLEDNKQYHIEIKSLGGNIASLNLKSEWPCLLVRGIKYQENQNITHEVQDEAGKPVKVSHASYFANYQILFIKPAPELKRVKLKTRYQQARIVEFLIAPDQVEFTGRK